MGVGEGGGGRGVRLFVCERYVGLGKGEGREVGGGSYL